MRTSKQKFEQASVLLYVLCTILVVSLIGGNVLFNCVTRYNTASSQVRSWKESLDAAETGGDIAYAEVRKIVLDPNNAFSGWTYSGGVYSNSTITYGQANLTTSSTVDLFYYDFNGSPWYRIRSKGTAPLQGLKRVTMDDRMGPGTRGDTLLRKIDFNFDHFIATYGPNGDNLGKTLVPVSNPQVTRRIELITAPVTPFEAAIKARSTFYGLGDAAMIDSYNSNNGPYYFCANNPTDPHYSDSRSGTVEIDTAVATIRGWVYGDVYTNGGTIVRSNYITGIIDNNVPFTIPPFNLPRNLPLPQPSPTAVSGQNVAITPPATGTPQSPTFYLLSSFNNGGKLTIYPANGGGRKTYVAIHVTNDMTGSLDIKPNVQLKIYVDGSMDLKGRDINNESGIASNLQYYAMTPADPSISQHVNINPPGDFAAAFYTPSADFTLNGNPNITGAVVCKTFYGNGNTAWHYDRELNNEGDAVDYRVVSYVEDTR